MIFPSMRLDRFSALAAALACGLAWGETSAPQAKAGPAAEAGSGITGSAYAGDSMAGAYRRHASLALFSLGSLAVGGVFYGIGSSVDNPNVDYTAGDRTRLATAAGAAGFTALIAAGSYFYFVRQDVRRAGEWNAGLSAVPVPGGGMGLAASLRIPIP